MPLVGLAIFAALLVTSPVNPRVLFRHQVEKGPAPRIVTTDPNWSAAEMRPSPSSGPGRSELRSQPPDGYSAVEETGSAARRVPWLRYGLIALGLTVVGYWAMRRNRQDSTQRL